MENQTDKLLQQLEFENGGSLEWKTYAFLLAENNRQIVTKGGLLYIVNGVLIFEDFESDRPIYRILGAKRTTYKKTKLKGDLSSITLFKKITRRDALRVLRGKSTIEQVMSPNKLQSLFDRTVHAIQFEDNSIWFCEIYDTEKLQEALTTTT